MIFTLFETVIFCLGWRIVTSEGKLLYFIRKPFDEAINYADELEERVKLLLNFGKDPEMVKHLQRKIIKNRFIHYIGKPFVTCITCFGSIWGFGVFVALNGLTESLIPHLIINCFGASFINTYIWINYAKMDI